MVFSAVFEPLLTLLPASADFYLFSLSPLDKRVLLLYNKNIRQLIDNKCKLAILLHHEKKELWK